MLAPQPQLQPHNRSVTEWLNHDFCPGANRYVYWLKEPVGWFVVALATSLLVGAFLSPLGWTVAAGLTAILVIGLGFPWLATRCLTCELHPVQAELQEFELAELELLVRNRLPLPILGLMVEGYLSSPVNSDFGDMGSGNDQPDRAGACWEEAVPDIGLAGVPALSIASYRLPIRPEFRGRYPKELPRLACAFPFGIWTARRPITHVSKVTVHPLLIPMLSELEFSGQRFSEIGFGSRPTQQGEFLGVRDFRRGDSLKCIHWSQSARQDRFIVCERGGPEQQAVELQLSTDVGFATPALGMREVPYGLELRENLAWRVRIVASLIDVLVSRHLPFQLSIDGRLQRLPAGQAARRQAFDRLADIPLDGRLASPASVGAEGGDRTDDPASAATASRIRIDATDGVGRSLDPQHVRVSIRRGHESHHGIEQAHVCVIDLDRDITEQLTHLLMEAARVNIPA